MIIPPDAGSLKIPILYRYQLFAEDRLRQLVENDLIYFSNPKGFNDPWDCRPWFSVPSTEQERKKLVADLQRAHQKRFPNRVRQERRRAAATLLKNPDVLRKEIEDVSREMWKAMQEQYRVFCLSTHCNCPLMWAHYADHHRGVCLGFDGEDVVFGSAMQVQYCSDYPVYDLFGENHLAPFISKSDQWRYEGEFRVVSEERKFARSTGTHKTDNGMFKIGSGALRKIISWGAHGGGR